jgi:hypothetical protein
MNPWKQKNLEGNPYSQKHFIQFAFKAGYTSSAMSTSAMFMFMLLLLVSPVINYSHAEYTGNNGADPMELPAPSCKSYECPAYVTVHEDNELEIRRYANHTLWISTSDINVDNSFKQSTRAGFLKLFDYIKGNNSEHEKIQMTAPVLTKVFLSSRGSSCDTTFVVRLSVAKNFEELVENDNFNNQSLHAESWNGWCSAVRKFGGFATDENIADEAQRLKTSLLTTPWAGITNNTYNSKCVPREQEFPWIFDVAQYNSPFENESRFNEIWFNWDTSMDSNCT